MKRLTALLSVAGLILLGLLVASSGVGDVLDAIAASGWAAALVVLARAAAIAADGIAWRWLLPAGHRVTVSVSVLLRWIREAVNQLLPVAQVGGDLVGARLAGFWRLDGAMAGASVIVDVAIQAGTQLIFALIGLAILVALGHEGEIVRYAAIGLGIGCLLIPAFFVVQRREGARIVGSLLRKLAGGREWLGIGAVERLYERLGDIYANRRGVAAATLLHMGVWLFGSVEVWVALHLMGHPVSVAEALVIESLGQAVKGAAFAVPGGLGVQEGGSIALCAMFGVPPGPALALSLVKRVPDLVLGLPGLLAWQWLEGRRLFARKPVAASGELAAETAA